METTFAIHVDCDPLWVYGSEYGLDLAPWEHLIYQQALPSFLDRLHKHKVSATFFVIGKELARDDCRAFCQRAVNENHALANHTYSHAVEFGQLDATALGTEIVRCDAAIRDATGVAPIGFRAPGYAQDDKIDQVLGKLGYLYDSSTLPGPATAMMAVYLRLKGQAKDKSFAAWRNFFASSRITPPTADAPAQLPIAVLPYLRLPVHTTFIYQFGLSYLDFALRALSRSPGHHVLLFHAIDFLDCSALPDVFHKLPALAWDFQARSDLTETILTQTASQCRLTETYLPSLRA